MRRRAASVALLDRRAPSGLSSVSTSRSVLCRLRPVLYGVVAELAHRRPSGSTRDGRRGGAYPDPATLGAIMLPPPPHQHLVRPAALRPAARQHTHIHTHTHSHGNVQLPHRHQMQRSVPGFSRDLCSRVRHSSTTAACCALHDGKRVQAPVLASPPPFTEAIRHTAIHARPWYELPPPHAHTHTHTHTHPQFTLMPGLASRET
jgi:hypothetical protein